MRAVRALLVGLVVMVAWAPGAAQAQSRLADGRRLKSELRYEAARAALEGALREGSHGPAEVAEIYLMLGEVTAGLGERMAAEAYFARLIALRPGFSLPPGASPKLTAPLRAARARVAGRGLSISHRIDEHRVTLVVGSDPLGMVAGARARYVREGAAPSVVEARGRGSIELTLPGRGPVRVELAAIDEHGNELAIAGGLSAGRPPPPSRSLLSRWQLWGGIGVALAATGTGFGLAARAAERDLAALNERARQERFEIDFSEAETLRTRAERYALVSNAAFAGTAAVGVAAAVLLVRELRAPAEDRRLTISPAWRSGALGVAVGGAF